MKPILRKIDCPNKSSHPGIDKTIAIFSERQGHPPNKLWIHCGCQGCRWIELRFNRDGGVTAEIMPEKVNFNVKKAALMVVDNA